MIGGTLSVNLGRFGWSPAFRGFSAENRLKAGLQPRVMEQLRSAPSWGRNPGNALCPKVTAMRILHDGPGGRRWITVTDDGTTRYLWLDGCEEGAMTRDSEEPVFNYLWFHKLSVLAVRAPRRILVLGAGAFTAPKCLALDYPAGAVAAVDEEPELEAIGRRFFRLDQTCFRRIVFHGRPAEAYLGEGPAPCDFLFDDLFDGFQHVPIAARSAEHVRQLWAALAPGGVCVKNLIWNPLAADTRAACTEVRAAWRDTFPAHGAIALGEPPAGHNLILIGTADAQPMNWSSIRPRLAAAGIPEAVLGSCHWQL